MSTLFQNSCENCSGGEQGRLQRAVEPQGGRWQQRGSVQQGWQGGGQGGWRVLRLPYVGQAEEQPSGITGALEGPYERKWDFEGADESYGRNPHLEGGDQNYKRQQGMLEAGQEHGSQHSLEEENWYRGQKESLEALKIVLNRKRYKYPKIQVGWEGNLTQLCNQEQACDGEEQLLDREQKRANKVSGRQKRRYQQHKSSLYAELPQLR